ncbi:MAG TPA: hypothetical protein VE152_06650 [Acidimicrobiales bacterium]|nr:hypothetical protein [Acidimicrobiales bacterium]
MELPGEERAALDPRVRVTDHLAQEAARHKVRIKDLVRQLMPVSPLAGDLGAADLAVLERWADPAALVEAGPERVGVVVAPAAVVGAGVGLATPSASPPWRRPPPRVAWVRPWAPPRWAGSWATPGGRRWWGRSPWAAWAWAWPGLVCGAIGFVVLGVHLGMSPSTGGAQVIGAHRERAP